MGAIQVLDGLDKKFFKGLPKALSPGDSVELYGEEGCGKTELLVHFCANCILPKSLSSINISGKETKVIFIDTSYKFPLWRLIQIIEHRIRRETKAARTVISTNEMDKIVKSCLQRLFIVQCLSSLNLMKTLSFLERLLNENPDISVMMIDNISEFYWVDRTIGDGSRYQQEANQRGIISKLKKYQESHSLVIVLVKSAIMKKHFEMAPTSGARKSDNSLRNPEDYLSPEWNKYLTYKYEVSKKIDYGRATSQTWYIASLKNQERTVDCKFTITDFGVEFLPD